MPCPSYPLRLDHSNYIWRRVQVMKLLIMQFSPTYCHFIYLLSKYSPQHFKPDNAKRSSSSLLRFICAPHKRHEVNA
jgi:hypothetical protein